MNSNHINSCAVQYATFKTNSIVSALILLTTNSSVHLCLCNRLFRRTTLKMKWEILASQLFWFWFVSIFRFQAAHGRTDLESTNQRVASEAFPFGNGSTVGYTSCFRPQTMCNLQSCDWQRAAGLYTHSIRIRLLPTTILVYLIGSTSYLLPTFPHG